MSSYVTKKELYGTVETIRKEYGLTAVSGQQSFIHACGKIGNIEVAYVPFRTPGLRGMVSLGRDERECDVIVLNSGRSPGEQLFSGFHELIHLLLHRNEERKSFQCYDKVREGQDEYLEWQANEGAAELLIPYRNLLDLVKNLSGELRCSSDVAQFRKAMVSRFHVSESVVKIRFESLKYEIYQYLHGAALNGLQILSKKQLEEKKICVPSLNDLENNFILMQHKLLPSAQHNHKNSWLKSWDPGFIQAENQWLYEEG